MRVYFYINKQIDPSTQSVSYITKDIITLEITNPALYNKLCIINVYNEVVTNTLSDLGEAIRKLGSYNELLVLGDFNLHYPLQSILYSYINNRIRAIQLLLTIIEEFYLELLTVLGTLIYRQKEGESTIDLTFASGNIVSYTIYYKVDTSLDYNSDYLLITIVIDQSQQPTTLSRKQLQAKTNL